MRRVIAAIVLALGLVPAAAALAAETGPVVDVVEIAGVIDRPIAEYVIERIAAAERDGDDLVVLHMDSVGGVKISDGQMLPPLVRAVRDAKVPVAVHVGPRAARAEGLAVYLAAAADAATIGPSARMGRADPIDVGRAGAVSRAVQREELAALTSRRGGTLSGDPFGWYGANAAVEAGLADAVVPGVDELLRRLDGKTVATSRGAVKLSLPSDGTIVRFGQPGPIRRFLHAFANPALVYVALFAAVLMIVFELFQPGFGVAGVTGGLILVATTYGFTVLPARWDGLLMLLVGFVLLTIDVARDELLVPTALGSAGIVAGSLRLFSGRTDAVRLSPWLIGFCVVSALIVFVPVMTWVRRQRAPVSAAAHRELIGRVGDVRSTLNPEGYVWVDGELWRGRSEDGSRMRVGEPITVASAQGRVLIVRPSALKG
ncbi:MAG: NfeD family protein [Actinomycetota bacterium]